MPEQTRICYLTEGSLLREAEILPDLKQYSIVILDEAHERSVNMEFLFGVLKRASAIREKSNNPLKVSLLLSLFTAISSHENLGLCSDLRLSRSR